MDPRLKEISENFDSWKIGLDDSFQFHCTECGKCCINREDILLTPRDLFRAAAALKLYLMEFVKKYCETYIGQDSRIPIIRLKPQGSVKRCPLLKDRRCSIHAAKPGVCAMFPVGRAIAIDKASYNEQGILKSQIQFILNPISCGDRSETHTVREWLTSFGIDPEDSFFLKWHSFVSEASAFIHKVEARFTEEDMRTLWTAIYIHAYLDYDPEKDFMEQFENNMDQLMKPIRETEMNLEAVINE